MAVSLIELSWLPEPPQDFRDQLRSLRSGEPDSRERARRLASMRLAAPWLHSLGRRIVALVEGDGSALRIGVLASGTVDLIYPAIAVSALRHGEWVQIFGTSFNQIATVALDPASEINRMRCHFVLLCIDHRGLPLVAMPGDSNGARKAVDDALSYIDSIRAGLRQNSGCTVIVQTLPQVPDSSFGSLERSVPGTQAWLIDRYNHELRQRIAESPDLLLDVGALAENVGLAQWHDPAQWALGKFPFAHTAVPIYAEWLGRLIAAARGRSRKCLVLDLDNTLWGGVIGDDGLEGIILGNGSPAGEAYLSIQQTALALRDRGVLLAVSSKNDDRVARNVFTEHPEMLLRERHISSFQANWQDKASNLTAIAQALNLGVNSLVLLDDNPAERAQVRAALPAVAVPELPDDPAYYSATLLAAGYFESVGITDEDRRRAELYEENAARKAVLGAATDLESYLHSLAMRATYAPFDKIGRARITQLINKTNQFNLTTRRYTEAEIASLEASPDAFTLQVRLIDRFGDNGMICVVICLEDLSDWIVDTWLMSCRVLNRRLEQATLNYIVAHARARGVSRIIGQYFKTERNSMVSEHYARLGFAPIHVGDAESRWVLDVQSYTAVAVPIELESAAVFRATEQACVLG